MKRIKTKKVLVATMLAVIVTLVGGCHSLHRHDNRHDNDYNYSRRDDYGRYDDRYYGQRYYSQRYYSHRYNGHRDYDRKR
jgi:hypothetical protein